MASQASFLDGSEDSRLLMLSQYLTHKWEFGRIGMLNGSSEEPAPTHEASSERNLEESSLVLQKMSTMAGDLAKVTARIRVQQAEVMAEVAEVKAQMAEVRAELREQQAEIRAHHTELKELLLS